MSTPKMLALGGAVIVAIIVFAIVNPLTIVQAGTRGVVTEFGKVTGEVLDEGIHWVTPVVQNVEKINVRTVILEKQTYAYSKDIQSVGTKIALNYHVNPATVSTLYQEVRKDFEEVIISPSIEEAIKSATAKFTAQDLIEKRPVVKEEIKAALATRLEKYFIVDDFSIVDFQFEEAYENAVEEKQVAQQEALKADNDLQRIKKEAEQRVAQAQAEAEAIRIQANAIQNQGGAEYVQLKWIEAWQSGGAKVPTYVTDGGQFLFNLNNR